MFVYLNMINFLPKKKIVSIGCSQLDTNGMLLKYTYMTCFRWTDKILRMKIETQEDT